MGDKIDILLVYQSTYLYLHEENYSTPIYYALVPSRAFHILLRASTSHEATQSKEGRSRRRVFLMRKS